MEKENNIQISLNSIKEVSFSCEEIPQKIDKDKLSCRVGFGVDPKNEGNYFNITTGIEFFYGAVDVHIMSFKVQTIFDVIGLESVQKLDNGVIKYEGDFLENIISITIGTLRGMVAVKVAGTALAEYPIPLIDVRAFVENYNKNE